MTGKRITVFYGKMRGQPYKSRSAGYCHSKRHRGRLSAKMIKQHGCLKKQCPCFEKYEEHPYWAWRERRKQRREV